MEALSSLIFNFHFWCVTVDSYKPTDVTPLWFPQACSRFCWWRFQNGPVLDNTLKEKVFFFERKSLFLCEWGEWKELGTSTSEGESTGWTFLGRRLGRQMKMVLMGTRQIDGPRHSRTFRLWHQNVIKLYINWFFFFLIDRALLLVASKLWREAVSSASSLQVWGLETVFFIIFLQLRPEIKGLGIAGERAGALFYTWAAFQKQPFPHFLSPQRVYLYSRPPPKLYDNSGNLLNQNKVYL